MPVEQAYVPNMTIEHAIEPADQFRFPPQVAETVAVAEPTAASNVVERPTVEVPAQLTPEMDPLANIHDISSAARVVTICRHDKLNQAA